MAPENGGGARRSEATDAFAARTAEGDGRRGLAVSALLFAAILGSAAGIGFVAYRLEVDAARRDLQQQLAAVGRLKAAEIAHWLRERRDDVVGAAAGAKLAQDVERWQATARIPPEEREWIRGRLARWASVGDLRDAIILDRAGRPLVAALSAGGAPVDPDLARRAVEENVAVSPIHLEPGGAAPVLVMDVVAPLTAVDARGSRCVGLLDYRIDVRRYLFPLVQSWPTDSPSAESYLVERDAGSVLFLNDLRHRSGTALSLRLPLDEPNRISAKALRGERGVLEGVDYRGVPSLAYAEAIDGMPWVLVARVDRAEAYAPLRDFGWYYAAFLAAAAIAAGASARTHRRALREEGLRREHEAVRRYVEALEASEAQREALIARLTKALDDVKTLRGIVPICASCKRIRDDAGFWSQVESYVARHTEAEFSHGLCPECARRYFPEDDGPAAPGPA